jgi:hypothetical protein
VYVNRDVIAAGIGCGHNKSTSFVAVYMEKLAYMLKVGDVVRGPLVFFFMACCFLALFKTVLILFGFTQVFIVIFIYH